MQYIRSKIKAGTFFFTIVAYERRIIFNNEKSIQLLKQSFREVKKNHPFICDAIVILPDHLHCILTLPFNDNDFSTRIMLIKNYFTRHCHPSLKTTITKSRIKKREQSLWQRRFWEHQIRDESDFINHVEYIHYNPVKHKLCESPKDWPYSSFQKFVREGIYDINWGLGSECGNFGAGYE